MAHCSKCGAENPDPAKFCVKCGAMLYSERRMERRGDDCFRPGRREEDECFGVPYGAAIAGILIGMIIVIVGLASFLGQDIGRVLGPLIAVAIGLLIVVGAVTRLNRRRSY